MSEGSSDKSEEDLLLKEMKTAGIDEASVPQLKSQIQEYLSKLKATSADQIDHNLLAFDEIMLDAIEDSKPPAAARNRFGTPNHSNSFDDALDNDNGDSVAAVVDRPSDDVDDGDDSDNDKDAYGDSDSDYDEDDYDDSDSDEEYDSDEEDDLLAEFSDDVDDQLNDMITEMIQEMYNEEASGSSNGEGSSSINGLATTVNGGKVDDAEAFKLLDEAIESSLEDDEEDEDADGDKYLSKQEWLDTLARYKKPAVTELEQERERVYSLFEDYNVESAMSLRDLQTFKQMR